MPQMQRHVALYDLHVPHEINLSSVLSFVKEYKPTHLIIGGDFLNLEFASHWNEAEFKYIGLERVSAMFQEEMLYGRDILAKIMSVIPVDCKRYFLPGNHEDWLYWSCLTYPAIAGQIKLGVEHMTFKSDLADIRKQVLANLVSQFLETDKYQIDVLKYGKELNLGKVTYIHGHEFSTFAAMKKKYPARNIICGHHHTHTVDTLHNSGQSKSINQYVWVPCLSKLSPGYLKDGSTRWMNGFWVCDVLPNGHFDGKVIKVIDNCVMNGGKVYK